MSQRFHAAWTVADDDTATPELLPMRLTQACVAALPVAAAGLSLFDHEFRVPLGASDDDAAAAERMQFTHGAGPCLEAATHQAAIHVDLKDMRARWPAFAADLGEHTPYRAILSVPLHISPTISGALDLYFSDPADTAALGLTDVLTVVSHIVDALVTAQAATSEDLDIDEIHPSWLFTPTARRRTNVWIALGMVLASRDLDAASGLALLRAFAYSRNQSIDELAQDMLEGHIAPEEILAA